MLLHRKTEEDLFQFIVSLTLQNCLGVQEQEYVGIIICYNIMAQKQVAFEKTKQQQEELILTDDKRRV
jgi:hypothetical protein